MTYALWNKTKNRLLVERLFLAKTTLQKMKGLLGRTGLELNEGILLEHCRSIHTCFMKFPIDAVFVDSGLRVTKIISNLKPWRLACAWAASHCIEVAAGTLTMEKLEVNDQLRLEKSPQVF